MSVPEIFSQYGEKRFRELEAQAVRGAAKEKGLIIATGGGAVLDPGNVRALKGNGRIYYLKRDLDLLSLDGRPLSKSRETLDKMFEARDPIYSNCADAAINNDLSPVLTAQRIRTSSARPIYRRQVWAKGSRNSAPFCPFHIACSEVCQRYFLN